MCGGKFFTAHTDHTINFSIEVDIGDLINVRVEISMRIPRRHRNLIWNVLVQVTSSYAPNPGNSSYISANSGSSYNASSVTNSYQNAYSSSNSYQATTPSFQVSITQPNSYPTNNQAYPQNTSQSVYGANSGESFAYVCMCEKVVVCSFYDDIDDETEM